VIPVFHGVVEKGVLVLEPRERYQRSGWLKSLEGQPVDVTVKRHYNKRSDKQNRLWWGIIVPLIAQETGYDKHEHEAVHYALVAKCFGVIQDERLGELPKVRSSQMTTAQFTELIEWAVRWAATEFGMNIPLPGDMEAA
jgi:hypothetical protein